jgi:hypothetical protein
MLLIISLMRAAGASEAVQLQERGLILAEKAQKVSFLVKVLLLVGWDRGYSWDTSRLIQIASQISG